MRRSRAEEPCVYALHGGDGLYAYVGSTSKSAKTRLWEHVSRARAGHSAPVYVWMSAVGIDSVTIEVIAVENNDAVRNALEVSTIVQLAAEGFPLVNQKSRDGVEGSMSSSSKLRIGAAMAGRTPWVKGRHGEDAGWTPERRRAQSERIRAINARRAA